MSEDCHDSGGGNAQVEQGSESAIDEIRRSVIPTATVEVYLDDGRVFHYDLSNPDLDMLAAKAREHCSAIIATGYRHNDGNGEFEHYPAHRISKTKVANFVIPTKYPDKVRGT